MTKTYTINKECENCKGKGELAIGHTISQEAHFEKCKSCKGTDKVSAEISARGILKEGEYILGYPKKKSYDKKPFIPSSDFSKFADDYLKKIDDEIESYGYEPRNNTERLMQMNTKIGLDKAKQLFLENVQVKQEE